MTKALIGTAHHGTARAWHRLVRSRAGASAVEFAILSPVFFVILGATMDFGGVLFVNFNLNSALSSATNYAILNASNVNASSGASLATSIAAIIGNSRSTGWADATVTVNNGPTATETGGATTTSGTAANANSCYCPIVSGSTVTWGSAVSCTSTCTSGAPAGKFVVITASRAYRPLFGSYGLVNAGTLSVTAVAQAR